MQRQKLPGIFTHLPRSPEIPRVERDHYSALIMPRWGVAYNGITAAFLRKSCDLIKTFDTINNNLLLNKKYGKPRIAL